MPQGTSVPDESLVTSRTSSPIFNPLTVPATVSSANESPFSTVVGCGTAVAGRMPGGLMVVADVSSNIWGC